MLPALPHQVDTAIWGEDYGEFVPDRFIRAEDKGGKFGNREVKCRGEVEEKDIERRRQAKERMMGPLRRGVTLSRKVLLELGDMVARIVCNLAVRREDTDCRFEDSRPRGYVQIELTKRVRYIFL